MRVDCLQRNQYRQAPDLADETGQQALVRLLGHPDPEEQLQDEERVGGDGEEVRFEGAEAGGLELQGQVLRHWVVRNQPGKAEEVDGPHVVIRQAVPECLRRQRLTVVHVALAGIVADDTIDHDVLLALVEPAFFASKSALGLRRRGR